LGRRIEATYVEDNGREATALSALVMISDLGVQADPDDFTYTGDSDQRYHTIGGNQQIPEAIAEHISAVEPRCDLRRSWRLTAVVRNPDGSVGLAFATPEGAVWETLSCDPGDPIQCPAHHRLYQMPASIR
jgi:monoamine oxidase